MRNRVLCILLALAVLAAGVAAAVAAILIQPLHVRAYQHVESPGPEACDADTDAFASHLPLVLIKTGGLAITEADRTPVLISIIDNENGCNRVTDPPALTTASLINLRGQTSLDFGKKQYRLNFVQSLTDWQREGHTVMGMAKEPDWVLNAPYLDKTLLRNYLMYSLAGELMDWAPNVRFCEVFLDGEYEGLYVMTEAVSADDERVDITRSTPGSGMTSYLLLQDRYGATKTPLPHYCACAGYTAYEMGVQYPNPDNITPEQIAYILNDIDRFEEKLYAFDYGNLDRSYATEIDMLSFVDYYILNEFSMNSDAGFFSTYAYRDLQGKLTMGPVWDFNNCFDNFHDVTKTDALLIADNNWFDRLTRDRVFVDFVLWRYEELRESSLSEERLLSMIDEIVAYLGPAAERNNERWAVAYETDLYNITEDGTDRELHTYRQAVDQLKNAIILRGRFLDANLPALLNARVINPK